MRDIDREGTLGSSSRTDRGVRQDERERHSVLRPSRISGWGEGEGDHRVFSITAVGITEIERRLRAYRWNNNRYECRSPVGWCRRQYPDNTRSSPRPPEMRYRDRSAPWKSGQPYPRKIDRVDGVVLSRFLSLSFILCDTFTFSGLIVTCFLSWHFDVCILARLQTHTHTLYRLLSLLSYRGKLVHASRWDADAWARPDP